MGEMLDKLIEANVFAVTYDFAHCKDKVEFIELCDSYYYVDFTKPELLQLITELQAIAEGME